MNSRRLGSQHGRSQCAVYTSRSWSPEQTPGSRLTFMCRGTSFSKFSKFCYYRLTIPVTPREDSHPGTRTDVPTTRVLRPGTPVYLRNSLRRPDPRCHRTGIRLTRTGRSDSTEELGVFVNEKLGGHGAPVPGADVGGLQLRVRLGLCRSNLESGTGKTHSTETHSSESREQTAPQSLYKPPFPTPPNSRSGPQRVCTSTLGTVVVEDIVVSWSLDTDGVTRAVDRPQGCTGTEGSTTVPVVASPWVGGVGGRNSRGPGGEVRPGDTGVGGRNRTQCLPRHRRELRDGVTPSYCMAEILLKILVYSRPRKDKSGEKDPNYSSPTKRLRIFSGKTHVSLTK